MSLQFAWDVVTKTNMFMAVGSGGRLSVWNFKDLPSSVTVNDSYEPSYSVQVDSTRRVTAAAFSHSGNHMAVAYDDASISMAIVLHYTQKISDMRLTGHLGNVYHLEFCRNDGFMVSAGRDDRIIIWNATDGSLVNDLAFYSGTGLPALFTSDSKAVISAERRNIITIRQFDGTRLLVIKTNSDSIKNMRLTGDGRSLAVLTGEDNIEFYNLETGEYYGYVPSFNRTSLTSYAFSSDNEFLLAGHADGSVYKLRLGKVMLKPGEKVPRLRLVAADEIVVKGSQWTERIPGSKDMDKFSQEDSLTVGLSGRLFPSPYNFGLEVNAEYRYVFRNLPLFIGASAVGGIGFPGDNFIYDYEIAGHAVSPPNLYSIGAYAPVGIQVRLAEKAPRIFAEISPGVKFQKLVQFGSGQIAAGRWFTSFAAQVNIGCGWKYFETGVGAEYDTTLGFWPRVTIAGRIPFGKKNAARNDSVPDKDKEKPE